MVIKEENGKYEGSMEMRLIILLLLLFKQENGIPSLNQKII